MNCRQQAIAAAVSVLLSASLSSHANTAEQATSHQPAQTQEAVIATSKEGVSDAIKQVEDSAANYVRAQKKHYRQQGREAEILIASGTALVSQPGTSPRLGGCPSHRLPASPDQSSGKSAKRALCRCFQRNHSGKFQNQ